MGGAYSLPGFEVSRLMVDGGLDPSDYVGSVFERISRLDVFLKAFITVRDRGSVEAEVEKRVEEARRGARLPLAGVLVAVKDNIHVEGLPVTCGSRMLSRYVAVYDATVVSRLRAAGAVVVGKTNMDEFAMGSTGETSAYGATRNPWDTSRVPGGSSSGTAAALAAGMATLGLGSDTGGSIRLPAAWTGLYGLKPSYGRVSRYGLVAYADSLEQIGPMARNVRDLALLYSVIAGFDPRDSTSLPDWAVDPVGAAEKGFREGAQGLRVVVLEDFLSHPGVSSEAVEAVEKAAERLRDMGAVIEYRGLGRSLVDYALPAYYVIAMAEASSNLARYDGVRYGPREPPKPWESWNQYYSRIRAAYFGREVKLRIMLGSWMLSSGYRDQYYVRALQLRRIIRDRLAELLASADALLLPAAVAPPPKLGEAIDDPEKLYALDLATVIANLSGFPALAIPSKPPRPVPLGVQLLAKPDPRGEEALFQLAAAHEAAGAPHDLVAEPALD